MPNPDCTRFRPLLAASLLLLLAGCVTSSAGDDGTRYHYAYWLPLCIFLGGIVFVPIGFMLRKSDARLAWGMMIVGPLAALGLGPTYLLEHTRVDNNGFESRIGFWGMNQQSVAFDSVKDIRSAEEETRGRRRRVFEVLYFNLKTGDSVRFPLGNDLNSEAGKDILKRAADRGIPIAGKE